MPDAWCIDAVLIPVSIIDAPAADLIIELEDKHGKIRHACLQFSLLDPVPDSGLGDFSRPRHNIEVRTARRAQPAKLSAVSINVATPRLVRRSRHSQRVYQTRRYQQTGAQAGCIHKNAKRGTAQNCRIGCCQTNANSSQFGT